MSPARTVCIITVRKHDDIHVAHKLLAFNVSIRYWNA